MKKIKLTILSCIVAVSLLASCGASPSSVPLAFENEYEVAKYSEFNSPTDENGLSGTKIKVSGKSGDIQDADGLKYIVLKSKDGDWVVTYTAPLYEEIDDSYAEDLDIANKEITVYGQFSGYSETLKNPVVNLLIDLKNNFYGGKIVIQNNYKLFDLEEMFFDPILNSSKEEIAVSSATSDSKPNSIPNSIPAPSTSSESETDSSSSQNSKAATIGEKNALNKAHSYLSIMSFSYQGLIEQLKYEKFTTEEATYAADNCGADWNEQALKKANNYLDTSPFSHSGLVGQLEFEKFTSEQANYGADNCGADWNAQAVKKAKNYLEFSSFSREGLIDQLKFEGFTQQQAEHGVKENGY